MRVLFELTVQLYEILLRVDRSVDQLQHQDAVCDLLYHIKYQFTGDSVKADAAAQELPPAQTEVSQEILLISCYVVLVVADVSHKGLNQHQAEMSQLHSSFINTTV